jgi:thiol peroxidase
MAQVTLKGSSCTTSGALPAVGSQMLAFTLVKPDLSEITQADLVGRCAVLSIFPSLDTPTCAMSVRTFNAKASQTKGAMVLCISMDLPFAASRFCSAEGLKDVVPASAFRSHGFGTDYGVALLDGPLKGLLARAVVVDAAGQVVHTQLVSDIASEPDYEAALQSL